MGFRRVPLWWPVPACGSYQARSKPQGRPLTGETATPGRTISEKPESVQHHTVDQEGLDSLLEQLAKKPGIHAVHLKKGDKAKVVPSERNWLASSLIRCSSRLPLVRSRPTGCASSAAS